jgi:hypothetical protein
MRFSGLFFSGLISHSTPVLFVLLALSPALPALSDAAEQSSLTYHADWQDPPWKKDAAAARRLWGEGRKEESVRRWEAAMEKGFQDVKVFTRLGDYFEEQEDWARAIRYFSLAIPRLERMGR